MKSLVGLNHVLCWTSVVHSSYDRSPIANVPLIEWNTYVTKYLSATSHRTSGFHIEKRYNLFELLECCQNNLSPFSHWINKKRPKSLSFTESKKCHPNQTVVEAPSGACVGPLCIQCRIAHANGELTSKRESRIGCCGFKLSNSFKCPFAEIETGKSFCQTTYWIYALRLNLVLFQSAIDCFICDGALWLLPQTCFLKLFF